MTIIIFDLDGTLTKRETYLRLLGLCIREFGIRRLSVFLLPLYVVLYTLRMISNDRLKEAFLREILSGISLKELESVSERFVSHLVARGLNTSIVQKLNMHLKQGDKVILVSASFDFYVIKIARKIGINHIVCTKAEVNSGILTGRILGRNCHGEEKARRIKEIMSESELSSSIFYTDHHSDLPLLRKVKKGVLVNPGLVTRLLLRKFNFAILK